MTDSGAESTGPAGGALLLRPMVHVADMDASLRFFQASGAEVVEGSREGDWVGLQLGRARIGLPAHPPSLPRA